MTKKEKVRYFNRGHFPVGTVFEFKTCVRDELMTGTVVRLFNNGPRSWVAETDQPGFSEGMSMTVNLCNATRIIKRGEGPLVIDVSNSGANQYFARENYAQMCMKYGKAKGDYLIADLQPFLYSMLAHDNRYTGIQKDHSLSIIDLKESMEASGILKKVVFEASMFFHGWRVNKQKFHRKLKQIIARKKMNRKVNERIYNDVLRKEYEAEMDREMAAELIH